MKHLFLPYELALKLKEKGFNESCLAFLWEYKLEVEEDRFDFFTEISLKRGKTKPSDCHASKIALPLYQQVIDWFRDTHGIWIQINIDQYKIDKMLTSFAINKEDESEKFGFAHCTYEYGYREYYEALNKAIEEALKLI